MKMMNKSYVIKRDGRREDVHFDKITSRLNKLTYGLDDSIDTVDITQKVISQMSKGIKTTELDILSAQVAATMMSHHPDYGILASRIEISNLHKSTSKSFIDVVEKLYSNKTLIDGEYIDCPLVSEHVYHQSKEHSNRIDSVIIHSRDYEFSYFGFKTLEKSYLIRISDRIIERPQHLYMRVALGIATNIDNAIEIYENISNQFFTFATPTMFNAGTPRPQMSSCFLLAMQDDSIDGIYDTLKQCAKISKYSGGIGLSISNVRASGSYIKGTNGKSNGIVPMLKVFDNTARYVDQGGQKRKGSFAIYIEPWHAEIESFLDLKKNIGKDEVRARDLFYALWVPDLFMKRVETDSNWSLFCPSKVKSLYDTYGEEFEKLYVSYEELGFATKVIKARSLWNHILESQVETGVPYMMYKDACNKKSNQKNLGTIRSSNLCCEIVQYSSKDEVAVCNLSSIALPKFVTKDGMFDFDKLVEVTRLITRSLNRIIDLNFYPVEEARRSNMKNRPIGIGVQGLADVFFKMGLPYTSEKAKELNRDIFETIYYAACFESCEIAKKDGPYESYPGSPISQGLFSFDLWETKPSKRWNWENLRIEIKTHGIRNSLLTAPMPTASTSQILDNTECFEPPTYLLYTRGVLHGNYFVVNKYLISDLIKHGCWNEEQRLDLIANNGSVQNMNVPSVIKEVYKTVWEIKQKDIIDMAADRGPFIDQSQSMNIHMSSVSHAKLSSMHFYAWKVKKLKTGMYYLRTQSVAPAVKVTVPQDVVDKAKKTEENMAVLSCSIDNKEDCLMCGS